MPKQRYSILRAEAEDNRNLRVLEKDYATRGAALKEARKLREREVKQFDSWADHFYIAILEDV